MGRIELFKKLLPGFIPLFVFIAADELWGTEIGLIVAIAVGIVELIITWFREKRFDKFILFDTALLVALGGISILLHNDIFFKLKPGLIELILCAILGVSAFSSFNIVGLMSQRYLKDVQMNEQQMNQIRTTMKGMFWLFLAHTALVFYSAFFMSKEAWVFISGGLFYTLFAVFFAVEIIRQKINNKKLMKEEWLPIVDEKGQVTGKAPRSICHKGDQILHPVVHLHVINSHKHIFLQKRPEDKLVQPGKWDTAVGGHISLGETLEESLKREAWEEIGLQNFNARLMSNYRWDTEVESELVYLFVTYDYKGINLHSDEVQEGKFWSPKQIKENLGKGIFTPNFEKEFAMLQKML
ncbi:NUDIX domain-containing protein [Puteibacter caeruleilacunae]|nr:NUDIX domain-containing protein [Puteibacter caeruleilacunae]